MRKVRKKLTAEQLERGVIFSSTLSTCRTEMEGDTTHEVFNADDEGLAKIKRLLDDKFFNRSPWTYNIIRGDF